MSMLRIAKVYCHGVLLYQTRNFRLHYILSKNNICVIFYLHCRYHRHPSGYRMYRRCQCLLLGHDALACKQTTKCVRCHAGFLSMKPFQLFAPLPETTSCCQVDPTSTLAVSRLQRSTCLVYSHPNSVVWNVSRLHGADRTTQMYRLFPDVPRCIPIFFFIQKSLTPPTYLQNVSFLNRHHYFRTAP